MTDTSVTYSVNSVSIPYVVSIIQDNATINLPGNTVPISIGASQHVESMNVIGARTGKATIQFHINVIEPISGNIIKTYDGKINTTTNSVDSITVDHVLLGDTITISWTGTLNVTNYFDGVYCTLIVKE